MVCFGKKMSVSKFDGTNFLSLAWTEINILKPLNDVNNIVFGKIFSALPRSEKTHLTPKETIALPFKLNGCSLVKIPIIKCQIFVLNHNIK